MRLVLKLVFVVVITVGTSQVVPAQTFVAGSTGSANSLTTLFARDPLGQSVCFKDGGQSGLFQNGQTRNRCSDLNFNSYSANGFSVGVEGGRQGVILDLGTPEELKGKYGYQETVGGGQGFASIDVKNGKALILKDYKSGLLQEIKESDQLFRTPSENYSSLPVKLGHVYLLRITDRNDKSYETFAKVLVVAYTPGESVTVRWQAISNNETAKMD